MKYSCDNDIILLIFKNPSLTNSSYYSENLTSQLANNESGAINYINKVINDVKQQLPPLSNVLHEDKIEKASSLLFKMSLIYSFHIKISIEMSPICFKAYKGRKLNVKAFMYYEQNDKYYRCGISFNSL